MDKNIKVIFKKLEFLDRDETPGINEDMEDYFDGKTVREVFKNDHQRHYQYSGWSINEKWFDECDDEIMKLFKLEL